MSAELDDLEPVLMADEIQGNILGGFNKDHQAVLPLYFGDDPASVARVRGWLASVLDTVTWLNEVVEYKRARREMLAAAGVEEASFAAREMPALWRNVAFSFPGLRKLTAEAEGFEHIFRDGLPAASFRVGDPAEAGAPGHVSTWLVGGPGNVPDMLFIIAGDKAGEVDEVVAAFLAEAAAAGITCPLVEVGHDLSFYSTEAFQFPRGREHFGFKDGVSQPGVRGRMSADPTDFLTPRTIPDTAPPGSSQPQFSAPGRPLVAAGEFVLGYRRQNESFARRTTNPHKLGPEPFAPDPEAVAPHWAKNGSFLVYRRLRQDVPAFNRFLEAEAERVAQSQGFEGMTAERLGALLVGRWRSGAPVLRTPLQDDPALGMADGANNAFGFMPPPRDPGDGFNAPVPDPFGRVCPQANHIRKVNPRDAGTDQGSPSTTLVRRILRRGIPYGEPLPFGATDDPEGRDRGLIFLSYQASIRDQFEFLAASWMNDPAKPTPQFGGASGFDMIVGQNPDAAAGRERFCLLRTQSTTARVATEARPEKQWVVATGGGYFFAPSRSAMRDVLARQPQ